ncbi:MAG TPA: kelch repeat-containing protein [Candidatus Limnocylindria bacterium]
MRRLLSPLLALAVVFTTGVAVGRVTSDGQRTPEPAWTVAGELARSRAYARAIALETGEILIVGGLDAKDDRVTIATTELFDPVTHRSTVLPGSLLGRVNQTLTIGWAGRVVVSGGTEWLGDHWNSVAKVDVFLPWARTWLKASPMIQARSDHAATALADGRVFVTGGNYNNRLLRSSEIYDPRTDVWLPVAPLPRPRTQFSAATLPDGSVLVAGGFQLDGAMTRTTLIYELWYDRSVEGPELREVRLNHSMVALPGGDLLFFGGERMGAGTAERYSWRDRTFVYAGVLAEPRLVAQGATLSDGRVLAVGGLPEDRERTRFIPTERAEVWDPGKRAWQILPSAPTKRAYAQLIVTDHGVYRLSGVGEDEDPFTTIEELAWR